MLNIKNLKVSYKNKSILKNINIDVLKGHTVIILGRTGSGKTSLLKSIANLIDFNGEILFDSKPIINNNLRIYLGTQESSLFNFKTVYENIVLGLKLRKINFSKNEILKLVEFFGLEKHINTYPTSLSGGQKQLVSLIRAIVLKPELLLLDEPFSALDYFTKNKALLFLLDYLKEKNCTTLIVTHNLEDAIFLGDYIYILGDDPTKVTHLIKNIKGSSSNCNSNNFSLQLEKIKEIFN